MDTIVRPPAAPPIENRTAPPPRPWWLRVLVALLIVSVIGLGLGVTWIANYDPLVAGSFPAFAPANHALQMKDVEAFGVSGRILRVEVQRGDRFSYRFSIRNHGPVGITVTRIGSSRLDQQGDSVTRYLVRVILDVWIRDGRSTLPAFEPWHAFTLRPGQGRSSRCRPHMSADASKGAARSVGTSNASRSPCMDSREKQTS